MISLFIFVGCDFSNQNKVINITIIEIGAETRAKVSVGVNVKQALEFAGITLNPLDKTEPSGTTILSENTTIRIIRVREEFLVEESILPFEQQTVKNESLPEGQSILIQAGTNGTLQTIYRILSEDGVESSRSFVNSEVTQPAKPEIVMLGVQSPYTSQSIPGVIAYITSSNAWVMDGSSGNRRPVVSTGDLDGRIFSISPDREWLLFSRSSTKENEINTLWVVNLKEQTPEPIYTNIKNVVHYADWVPGKTRTISYSTVEPVLTPPGWQANNDLHLFRYDEKGKALETKTIVETNSGGIYGWWGTIFEWSVDGSKIAYSRPDSIGLVDIEKGLLNPIIKLATFQTSSDWAWVPSIKWSEDGQALYTILLPESPGSSQNPALSVIIFPEKIAVDLIANCGLFCNPTPSMGVSNGRFIVGFLSAILPDQSETSRYNLKIMDRDGSNQKKLYPGEGIQGLTPQSLRWSPSFQSDFLLAFIAQGNLLLVDTISGSIKTLTGDGSISKIDWK